MKRGKKICKTLKEVRMQVAKANDIRYAPTECQHEGDCAGTCPKCEAEVREQTKYGCIHKKNASSEIFLIKRRITYTGHHKK